MRSPSRFLPLLFRLAFLVLSGLALAVGFSEWPLPWYFRGALLAGGLVIGVLLIANDVARQPSGPSSFRWLPIIRQTLLLLLWSEIALLGARYLGRSALPYFRLDVAGFGRLAPHRVWLFTHIVGGIAALLLGPIQLWPGLRARTLALHRWMGRGYALGVLCAGLSAFHLAWFIPPDEGGLSTGAAMDVLAIFWLAATAMAVRAILARRVPEHREWMIRSYALTLAFVTIRVQLDLPFVTKLGPASAIIPYVVWVAWIVPLGAAEALLRSTRRRSALAA